MSPLVNSGADLRRGIRLPLAGMTLEILDSADVVAQRAAELIATEAAAAIEARGKFVMAVSGGNTPWRMLQALAGMKLQWPSIHVLQVDERLAPVGHPDRNMTHILESLTDHEQRVVGQIYAMPVEEQDLDAAATRYAEIAAQLAGSPPVLDFVHLGLGADGHTASLVPQDAVLRIDHADVALTGVYQGHRRMTLTFPVINRARRIMWVTTGKQKAAMLARLLEGDPSIPAGRVRRQDTVVICDSDASTNLPAQWREGNTRCI